MTDSRKNILPALTGPAPETSGQAGPQLAPILRLHRHTDGYVSFLVGSGDELAPAIAIRSSELETYFPEWQERLMKDAYVSINASWRLRRYGPHGSATGYPKHDTANLRRLCACYVDIDCHKLGIDFFDAVSCVGTYSDKGKIPPASIIVRSGRGVWLLWLLCDSMNPDLAQRAFPEKVDIYSKIQHAIYGRLANIGADPAGRDAVRHIRVPGSFNTAGEQYVEWLVSGNGTGGFVYTLDKLARFFGVRERELQDRSKSAFDRQRNPNKARGWLALNDYRLRDFELLRSLRGGGFDEGHRNSAVLIYSWLLMHHGASSEEAHRAVRALSEESRPPLTDSQCRLAVKSVFQKKIRFGEQDISDRLEVTPTEAALLERYPAATRFHQNVPPKVVAALIQPKAPTADLRRAEILAIVQERGGAVPTSRAMAELLTNKGFEVAYVQVSKDYKFLNLKTERIHQWEAKAATRSAAGDLFTPVAYMKEKELSGCCAEVLSDDRNGF